MKSNMISFNKAYFNSEKLRYLEKTIVTGKTSGDGLYTKKCHSFIEDKFMTKKALLTASCSLALDMSAIILNLKEGDEVIMPSFNFVSTANSVVLRGAKPIFAEIDEETLNIDPEDIKNKITQNTKAIFPVHYAGVSCDMDEIMNIAKENNLMVVEDAAQGVNAKYKGKYLGTIGDIGCYSFHETKNYSCGEGGAILINHDKSLSERAEIIREKGTNRSKFFRGEVDKYTWVDMGSSYLISDILAAMLYAQFESLDEIQVQRERIHNRYMCELKDLEKQGVIKLPHIPKHCQSNYHIFRIMLNSQKERDYLLDELKKKGIGATFHYIPLHTSPMGEKLGYKKENLQITEKVSDCILRLPIYSDLRDEEVNYILDSIYNIMKK